MNRNEAAEYLGISKRSVQRHKDNGDLAFHRVGGLIRYLRADLDAFPVRFEARGRRKRIPKG
jgi:excisionase family DNA binding protein